MNWVFIFSLKMLPVKTQWESVIADILGRSGQLDIMVNNAGIFSSAPIDETPLAQWQQVLDINLTGVFLGWLSTR